MADVTGKIKIIGELQTFASGFTKVQVVVTSDEQYPSDIPIEFFKDKASLLDHFNVEDSVKIDVNIKGSEYQGKYYVGLIGWRISKQDTSKQTPDSNTATTQTNPQPSTGNNKEIDDLPF